MVSISLEESIQGRRLNRQKKKQALARRRIVLITALSVAVLCIVGSAAFLTFGQMEESSSVTKYLVPKEVHYTEVPEVAIEIEEEVEPYEEVQPPAPHAGRLIIIDPGHQAQAMNQHAPIGPGATQTRPMVAAGTRGVSTGVAEYIVVLDIGLKLRDALIEEGYEVYMVRETHDVQISNKDRALRGNELGGDLMVRLHCDGSPNPNVHGFMTLIPANGGWTEPIYAKSRQAGEHVHREVLAAIGAYDRGIIERGDLSGFNWSTIPSILLEMGVMTNAREDELLSDPDYQDKIVQGIVNGLNAYFADMAEFP